MPVLGFHASHEQLPPSRLLAAVQHAEAAGFDAAMCSDHLAPWSLRQAQSGFAFSWLAAALATTSLRFGVVTAPGQRYHPVVHAQALATLAEMFPGRFWAALGSGEAMNEHVTGDPWPEKPVRERRLRECVDVIRRLLHGEVVSHDGHVVVDRAQLWTLADPVPHLVGPAVTPQTAARHADWADGLITVNQPVERLREVLAAYRDAGGRGPARLQVHLSWARTQEEAGAIAHDQWRSKTVGPPIAWDVDSVEGFDAIGEHVAHESVAEAVRISADPGQHVEWLQEYLEIGYDELYLHFVGQDQREYLDTFAEQVLPHLGPTRPETTPGTTQPDPKGAR